MNNDNTVIAIKWQNDSLLLLDQRLLPQQVSWLEIKTVSDAANAIRDMVVRGAPAIVGSSWPVRPSTSCW